MKRTRSDQSLAALSSRVEVAAPTDPPGASRQQQQQQQQRRSSTRDSSASDGSETATAPCSHPQQQQQQPARGPWLASLPAVASDGHGSSDSSLVSFDSPAASSQSLQGLSAGPQQPAQQQQQQQQAQQHPREPGPGVSYLPAVGSASSLQHGGMAGGGLFSPGGGGGGGEGDLQRARSDGSDAAPPGAFRVEAPRGYSPPPLLSPGPAAPARVALPALRTAAAPALSSSLYGTAGAAAPQVFAAAAAAAFSSSEAGETGGWGALRGRGRGGFTFPMRSAPAAAPADPPAPAPQPAAAAAPADPDWDFSRRAQAVRDARKGSGSSSLGRRRSSIEATMPWRARLDDAIAAADAGSPRAATAAAADDEAALARLEAMALAAEGARDGGQQPLSLTTQDGAGAAPRPPSLEMPSYGNSLLSIVESEQRSSMESEGDAAAGPERRRSARFSGSGSASGSEGGRSVESPTGGPRFGKARQSSSGSYTGYYSRQNEGGAAFELFVRLNRARQTLGESPG
jgi:hypothetical protein